MKGTSLLGSKEFPNRQAAAKFVRRRCEREGVTWRVFVSMVEAAKVVVVVSSCSS